MRIKKKFALAILIFIGVIWLYTNSLICVDEQVKNYYAELKRELKRSNYKVRLFVISGRRWKLDNYLLTKFSGAASKSKHKVGQAIDIIVLDINDDGTIDAKDVDIVYQILDQQIIKDKGGLGTYKNESGFFSKQQIHFDCRGVKAR